MARKRRRAPSHSPQDDQSSEAPDRPNVPVLPPVVYLTAILLGVALQLVWPMALSPWAGTKWLGLALAVLSGGCVVWAVTEFRRWETSFRVDRATTNLVQTGPFRYSRNPGYLALSGLHMGIAIYFNTFWILATLVPALFVMSRAVIAREEEYLERKFGAQYTTYKGSVRRWL